MTTIARDEVIHTELSRDLADAFGGYICEIPDAIPYDPPQLGEPNGLPLAYWLVGVGCISNRRIRSF